MSFKKARQYFKFCPVCAGRLLLKKHGPVFHLTCRSCDFIFYQNSKPTASAFIVNQKNQILLVKRAVEPMKGYWDAPGGFLEDGEDPIKGLRREMKEELGVQLADIQFFGIYLDVYNERYAINTLNIIYLAKILKGKLQPMDDISEAKWFSASQIPWSKLGFPWLYQALRDWQKHK